MLICSCIFVYDDECNKVNFLISAALCSELISPINGKVTWTGLTSGSTATYTRASEGNLNCSGQWLWCRCSREARELRLCNSGR